MKLRLTVPVIVEGKYDKARLAQVVDAVIVPTDGFAVFNNAEKRALIRRLASAGRGLILLSDSDGGGRLIRSHLRGMLDGAGAPVYDLYVPAIRGKEPRKSAPSKAGILGVEGVPNEILRDVFSKFAASHPECVAADSEQSSDADADKSPSPRRTPVTKALLYELGLNGTAGSGEKRAAAAEALGFPRDMTVNAFCAAANLVSSAEELAEIAGRTADRDGDK